MEASEVASELLAGVGTRLAHSRAVARQATIVEPLLDYPWSPALLDAAWLHDVGYAPDLSVTGFHPIDGARWLRSHGWPAEVCCLVAWHTRAGTEASLRALLPELVAEFPRPPSVVQAVLTWADLTSSPSGGCCTVGERLDDILDRYPSGSVVRLATIANRSALLADVAMVEAALGTVQAARA